MALILLLVAVLLLFLGYRLYASRVDLETLRPDPRRSTPARRQADGQDFLPVSPGILFPYQLKSISLDPILGPVIAVQFGWLPAVLWLICGVFLAGWVQDYASAMISTRSAGLNLGQLAKTLLSPAAAALLQLFIYLFLLFTLGSYGAITAPLLSRDSVPTGIFFLTGTGVLAGQMLFRWRISPLAVAFVTVLLALIGAYLGNLPEGQNAVAFLNRIAGDPRTGTLFTRPLGFGNVSWEIFLWTVVLLGFAYLGAVLPIWRFALPVNFTAGWLLLLGMAGALAGILIRAVTQSLDFNFEIPALVSFNQPQLGPLWPILFVTITGGAISGWHALVTTFSTARLVEREPHILPLTAGAAFTQTLLALLAVVFAVTLGVTEGRYDPNRSYTLVAGPASIFTSGMARFLNAIGLPETLGDQFAVVLLASMTLTVLQLVLRFMRQVSSELVGDRWPVLKNRHLNAFAGCLLALILIVFGFWPWLWILLGGSSLAVAGIALLLASIWLARQSKSYHWTLWPGIFVSVTGIAALSYLAFYNALYKGIILPGEVEPGPLVGNAITAAAGTFMLFSAAALFYIGLSALHQTRRPRD